MIILFARQFPIKYLHFTIKDLIFLFNFLEAGIPKIFIMLLFYKNSWYTPGTFGRYFQNAPIWIGK